MTMNNTELAQTLCQAQKNYDHAARMMNTGTRASVAEKRIALDQASDDLVAAIRAIVQ